MPSQLPGYEYDIFISYRHNDNRSGWVTEFVAALQAELASTIKEPISIYFDTNPHDGLLENHDVDKSLEGKLRCLIFIPIISQTYCDPKSFAWQQEFCAFNKLAQHDEIGRDIRLGNGNVASRILPIKIHELDAEDTAIIEKEIGSVLRAIEFIYKEAGVNRPLAPEDSDEKNINKTKYKNQVNKVANAIKEIVYGLKKNKAKPTATDNDREAPVITSRKRGLRKTSNAFLAALLIVVVAGLLWYNLTDSLTPNESLSKSIAVLAFADMSPEKDQEYLGDGIAEEIINLLTKIDGLKVIGRTSSFSYKGQNTDLKEIGETLGVGTILEGSVRKSGNRIRITAQLINTEDGSHLWSESFDKELKDIFSIQDEISQRIADKFEKTIAFYDDKTRPTQNIDAYELYLKGKYAYNKRELSTDMETARDYLAQAVSLDPNFTSAYIELSKTYWSLGFYGLVDRNNSYELSKETALKAAEVDPHSYMAYDQLSFINATVDWDWEAALDNYNKALAANDGNPIPTNTHSVYMAILNGGNEASIAEVKKLVELDPLSVELLTHLSRSYLYAKRFDEVIETGKKTLALSPNNSSIMRHTGSAYLYAGNFEKAEKIFGDLLRKDSTYAPYGNIDALIKLDRPDEARIVFNKVINKLSPSKKAICFSQFNELDSAFFYLNKAYSERDVNLVFIKAEPIYDLVRDDLRYNELLTKMNLPID